MNQPSRTHRDQSALEYHRLSIIFARPDWAIHQHQAHCCPIPSSSFFHDSAVYRNPKPSERPRRYDVRDGHDPVITAQPTATCPRDLSAGPPPPSSPSATTPPADHAVKFSCSAHPMDIKRQVFAPIIASLFPRLSCRIPSQRYAARRAATTLATWPSHLYAPCQHDRLSGRCDPDKRIRWLARTLAGVATVTRRMRGFGL